MGTFEDFSRFLDVPSNALYLVSPVIIIYDILLTFSWEVHCIWKWKFSTMTILYAVIRYGALLQVIVRFLFLAWRGASDPSKFLEYGSFTMDVLEMTAITVFSFLRAWAVTRFRFYYGLPFAVLLMGLVAPCIFIYGHIRIYDIIGTKIAIPLSYVPHISAIITNLLVIGITWKTMTDTHRMARQISSTAPSLVSTFLSHGNMYFCVIFALHIPMLLPGLLATFAPVHGLVGGAGIVYLQLALTSILISRFILELRLVDFQANHSDISASSFINFATRTVGSLGAPLDEGARSSWNDPDIDEEGLELDPEGLPIVSVLEHKV